MRPLWLFPRLKLPFRKRPFCGHFIYAQIRSSNILAGCGVGNETPQAVLHIAFTYRYSGFNIEEGEASLAEADFRRRSSGNRSNGRHRLANSGAVFADRPRGL